MLYRRTSLVLTLLVRIRWCWWCWWCYTALTTIGRWGRCDLSPIATVAPATRNYMKSPWRHRVCRPHVPGRHKGSRNENWTETSVQLCSVLFSSFRLFCTRLKKQAPGVHAFLTTSNIDRLSQLFFRSCAVLRCTENVQFRMNLCITYLCGETKQNLPPPNQLGAFSGLFCAQNAFATGDPPRTPLGKFTVLLQTP